MKKNATKLTLNRETLRLLDTSEIKEAVGGMPITRIGNTCDDSDCFC
jgi:predicted component of type VI protein secretion system